jgi:KDO2-lipid IV(A) lauroyltransferase
MNVQDLLNSRFTTNLGLGVARIIPKQAGYALARLVASRIVAKGDDPLVKAVRLNQWIVHEQKPTKAELDQIVADVFRLRAYALYDFFSLLASAQSMKNTVDFGAGFTDNLKYSMSRIRGTVALITHSGAHELVAIAAGLHGMEGLALTSDDQIEGYVWHNELRKRVGYRAIPTTMSALKEAIRYLQEGGTVITGIERPLPNSGYCPRFFGFPTSLPVHYVTLALKAKVPLVVLATKRKEDGTYSIELSPLIEIQVYSSRKQTILRNAENILSYAEQSIRSSPLDWSMPFPLWPEMFPEVP